jgi:hypothetical protein
MNEFKSPNEIGTIPNQGRSIDISQSLYSGDYSFGSDMFTPDIQSTIIDHHFNGGDSVHSLIGQRINQLSQERQQQNQQPAIAPEELENLRRLQDFMKTPQFTAALAQVMSSDTPIQPTSVQGPQTPIDQPIVGMERSTDPFADLFSHDTQEQQPPQVAEPQRQNQPSEQQAYEEMIGLCARNSVNPQDFVSFMQSLTQEDMMLLYKEFQTASREAQQQVQVSQAQQQQQPPSSIQNIPVQGPTPSSPGYQQPKRNPLWD